VFIDSKKIVAIGKNYEAHAREMGATSAPKDPVLFLKPTSSYVRNGGSVLLPPGIGEVHHEVELGVRPYEPVYLVNTLS
jgi:acylpyruvate hydrolase